MNRGSRLIAATACLGVALASPVRADRTRTVATVDRPAVVTAVPSAPERGAAGGSGRVILGVTGFVPSPDGTVQAVVKAARDGAGPEREIGRFGIFPDAAFTAPDPSRARRFAFKLPEELAGAERVRLNVYLVPLHGDGKGARLDLGSVELH